MPRALHEHGLLKGRHLGLVHRNTEAQYWSYVKRLAAEAGIDPDDTKAVRRFDRKRADRGTSSAKWASQANCHRTERSAPDKEEASLAPARLGFQLEGVGQWGRTANWP